MYQDCRSLLNTPVVTNYTYDGTVSPTTIRSVIATPIQIRFQITDSVVVPIPTASLDLPPVKTGLSKGAKAGIAVGVVVGAVAVIATVVLFIKKRSRRGAASEGGQHQPHQGDTLLQPVGESEERPPPYSKH